MLQIDHIGIPARDARRSAQRLAAILGAPEPKPEGLDDDMFRIDLEDGAFVLFNPAHEIELTHLAFRVDTARFDSIVGRLRAQNIPFGNDPEDTQNGATEDHLGGAGRVYFVDDDGHLFEVTC